MKKPIITFLYLLLFFIPASSSQNTQFSHKLSGVVRNVAEEVVHGLRLKFSGGEQTRYAVTNVNGEFEVVLAAGQYEAIFEPVNLYGFNVFIKITENGPNPSDLKLTVNTNKVCCFTLSGNPYPKPTSLPKPPFPPAARAVRATGEVIVTVKINKEGRVTFAESLNGHPLLRKVAEAAAKGSRFELSESDQEREAKLIYIFAGDEDEKTGIIRYSNSYKINVKSLF